MKKTILVMKPIIILAMILSLGFTSCKKGWWGYDEGNGGGGNGGGNGNKTLVQGTVYTLGCGLSIYGKGLWIKLDDGTLLQPCAQSFKPTPPIELKEGDRVELNYSGYKGNYPDFEPSCNMRPIAFERVTIDFINVLGGKTNDCKPITLQNNYEEQEAAMGIIDAKVEGSKLKLNIGYSGCNADTKRFTAIAELNLSNDIPTYAVKLIDSDSKTNCQAYFIDDICFDLETIRKPESSKKIRIIIYGTNKIFEF
jgi:hypothetical protein